MLWRTEKTELTTEDIEEFIQKHQREEVADHDDLPGFDSLWKYFLGQNPYILGRRPADVNTPQNNTPVSYGRKIINTFVGYAYRPRYITYKSDKEQFLEQLQTTFDVNQEHIRTSRSGRNTGIFGVAYELVYIDGRQPKPEETPDATIPRMAEAKFINVDPRECILLYDFSAEPQKVIGIRYYRINPKKYVVDVYYADTIIKYTREQKDQYNGKWEYTEVGSYVNFFGEVPIVPYHFGDEMLGIVKPVTKLIDDYDVLVSDSIVEFDRFANAYLRLVGMSVDNLAITKRPGDRVNNWLQNLRRFRIFQNLPKDVGSDAVTFLTKDIPKEFIEFMTSLIQDEIHKQSHVPDFMSEKLGGDLSGVAVQRMMFDFENLVSAAEGDFDLGLSERIRLIAKVYELGRRNLDGGPQDITISHKRNTPENIKEFAETAKVMMEAGFSRALRADIMPDDVVPDVQEELDRQDEDRNGLIDVENVPEPDQPVQIEGAPKGEDVQAQALNGAQIKSLVDIVSQVAQKALPAEAAIAILLTAIPSLTEADARAMIGPAESFKVEPNARPTEPVIQPDIGGA